MTHELWTTIIFSLLQAEQRRAPFVRWRDSDELAFELLTSFAVIIFQSMLRFLVSLLIGMLFLPSFSYAGEGSAAREARWQRASARKDTQVKNLASLSPIADLQALDELFGFFSTVPISSGELREKWNTVRNQVELERSALSSCVINEECPAAARRFLEIVAEGRRHQGLARVGVRSRRKDAFAPRWTGACTQRQRQVLAC